MSLFYNDFLCQRATLMQLHEIMQSTSVGIARSPAKRSNLMPLFLKDSAGPFSARGSLMSMPGPGLIASFSGKRKVKTG